MEINITELLEHLKNSPRGKAAAEAINSNHGQKIKEEMLLTVDELYWRDHPDREVLIDFIRDFFSQYNEENLDSCPCCRSGNLEMAKANEPFSEDHFICNKCDSTYCA